MNYLEKNGYHNVTGLKRAFAIEVDNYDEKEKMLHNIFSKSQVQDSELFTLDIDLAKQLLSAFEGIVIYPKENKKDIFIEATDSFEEKGLDVNRHHFKEIEFYSSLTGKRYKGETSNEGTLSIIDLDTNDEVPNNSNPSKKRIILCALKDLGIDASNDETLYQLYHKLTKVVLER